MFISSFNKALRLLGISNFKFTFALRKKSSASAAKLGSTKPTHALHNSYTGRWFPGFIAPKREFWVADNFSAWSPWKPINSFQDLKVFILYYMEDLYPNIRITFLGVHDFQTEDTNTYFMLKLGNQTMVSEKFSLENSSSKLSQIFGKD